MLKAAQFRDACSKLLCSSKAVRVENGEYLLLSVSIWSWWDYCRVYSVDSCNWVGEQDANTSSSLGKWIKISMDSSSISTVYLCTRERRLGWDIFRPKGRWKLSSRYKALCLEVYMSTCIQNLHLSLYTSLRDVALPLTSLYSSWLLIIIPSSILLYSCS